MEKPDDLKYIIFSTNSIETDFTMIVTQYYIFCTMTFIIMI